MSVTYQIEEQQLSNVTSYDSSMSCSSDSESDFDDIPLNELLLSLSQCDEDLLLAKHGYDKLNKIRDTTQGEIFLATTINTENPSIVEIKKCDKECYEQKISLPDEYNMRFTVEEDILKEKSILQCLNGGIDNKYINARIVQYVKTFESESYYYLVTQQQNKMTLKQFSEICHEYIKNGVLKAKIYNKIIKHIAWQISLTLHYLHFQMKCCHLNLNINNIIIENGEFIQKSNGMITINPLISVRLCDFSKSEIFEKSNYSCMKIDYVLSDVQYCTPQYLEEEMYDARAADMWSLGHILYECVIGEPLYSDINPEIPESEGGYWAVMTNNVNAYVRLNNLVHKFDERMLSTIIKLLAVDESERLNSANMLKCKWFKTCYQKWIKCKKQIQVKPICEIQEQIVNFPFYSVNCSL